MAVNRRAMSVGPGIHPNDSWDVEEGSDEDEERDDVEDLNEPGRDDRGRGRNMNRTGTRSMSLMPERAPGFPRMTSGDITPEYPRSTSPEALAEASESTTDASCPNPRARVGGERFLQTRGPSPAYALRDPLRNENGSARGRKTSPRRRLPLVDQEERDITDFVLSPIASIEGSRFPSPSGPNPDRQQSQAASSSSIGVRFDPASGSSDGPSDSEESLAGEQSRPKLKTV
jgi:hypothetical protein